MPMKICPIVTNNLIKFCLQNRSGDMFQLQREIRYRSNGFEKKKKSKISSRSGIRILFTDNGIPKLISVRERMDTLHL